MLTTAADHIRTALARLGRAPANWGLIRADLHPWNVLWQRGTVGVIDFADCGPGPYLYDLAVALDNWMEEGSSAARRAALLEGYSQVRPPPAGVEGWLRLFTAANCYKTITRWAVATPDLRVPPARVVSMVQRLGALIAGPG